MMAGKQKRASRRKKDHGRKGPVGSEAAQPTAAATHEPALPSLAGLSRLDDKNIPDFQRPFPTKPAPSNTLTVLSRDLTATLTDHQVHKNRRILYLYVRDVVAAVLAPYVASEDLSAVVGCHVRAFVRNPTNHQAEKLLFMLRHKVGAISLIASGWHDVKGPEIEARGGRHAVFCRMFQKFKDLETAEKEHWRHMPTREGGTVIERFGEQGDADGKMREVMFGLYARVATAARLGEMAFRHLQGSEAGFNEAQFEDITREGGGDVRAARLRAQPLVHAFFGDPKMLDVMALLGDAEGSLPAFFELLFRCTGAALCDCHGLSPEEVEAAHAQAMADQQLVGVLLPRVAEVLEASALPWEVAVAARPVVAVLLRSCANVDSLLALFGSHSKDLPRALEAAAGML